MPGIAITSLFMTQWQSVNVYKLEQERQHMCNITLSCICATIVAVEKQYVLNILSVFVALVTQHAKHMCFVILSTEVSPALQHFFHMS
jgi:hypothetical protein